ncbi:MAG: Undecaprenyl-phosphate 4-deoxy-4-formamido-L-arabinose transferase, partial [Alphaproteobacteria bacterium MarineAlpha6_Bin4]
MNFSIIIPVYNEINYIPKILKKLFNLKIKKNIKLIIVDDSSTDGTKNWLKSDKPKKLLNNYKNKKNNFIMKIILKKKNEGKGSAIIEGLKYTKENDVILIQDADLEYNPNDIPKLLKLIENGNDVVFGNRFHFNNHYHYKIFAIANYIISSFTSIIFFYKISDTAACYKIFKRRILKNLITLKE